MKHQTLLIIFRSLWISPRLPLIKSRNSDDNQFDSKTNFKKDLLHYLRSYNLTILEQWIEKLKNADCSEIK